MISLSPAFWIGRRDAMPPREFASSITAPDPKPVEPKPIATDPKPLRVPLFDLTDIPKKEPKKP